MKIKYSYILNLILSSLLLIVLFLQEDNNTTETTKDKDMNNLSMTDTAPHRAWVSLTVAESKRLIAKGITKYPVIREKWKQGGIIITRGSTTSYIAEELTGEFITPGSFLLGRITPSQGGINPDPEQKRTEIYLKNGKYMKGATFQDALHNLNTGDIVLKGGNALNYQEKIVGGLIGHPEGGTYAALKPYLKKGIRLIIPIGLEKQTSSNLKTLFALSQQRDERQTKGFPQLWHLKGEPFTEIEALKQFAQVNVYHLASGGIGGAEGAVTLLITGSEIEVKKALSAIEQIHGEMPFTDRL